MTDREIRLTRKDYQRGSLTETDLHGEPVDLFVRWYQEASEAGIVEPEAMALATVDPAGHPSCRILLMRGVDERGLRFFTSRESRKGRELDATKICACTFWWGDLERQVRVEGAVERLSDPESDAYFESRPRASRLSAWASPQSEVLESDEALAKRVAEIEERYPEGSEIPRPPFWGGYLVRPSSWEFWQGRPSRRHDRFLYRRDGDRWNVQRLAP